MLDENTGADVSHERPDEFESLQLPRGGVAVLAAQRDEYTGELLGDASDVADRLGTHVSILASGAVKADQAQSLIERGADIVVCAELGTRSIEEGAVEPLGPRTRLSMAERWFRSIGPRILFACSSGEDRELAARLSVRCHAQLLSLALYVRVSGGRLDVTALHPDGRRARQVTLDADQSAVVVLRPGVAHPARVQAARTGRVHRIMIERQKEPVAHERLIAADPTTSDIEHLPRLIAGGRGLGGSEGFERLRLIARRLDAGVAASRMAVDLGWIERQRQVGQTGKTVRPELYVACGISGASHHLEGMSDSRHIVAINVDRQAPIFRVAHLGLVADYEKTLQELEALLTL